MKSDLDPELSSNLRQICFFSTWGPRAPKEGPRVPKASPRAPKGARKRRQRAPKRTEKLRQNCMKQQKKQWKKVSSNATTTMNFYIKLVALSKPCREASRSKSISAAMAAKPVAAEAVGRRCLTTLQLPGSARKGRTDGTAHSVLEKHSRCLRLGMHTQVHKKYWKILSTLYKHIHPSIRQSDRPSGWPTDQRPIGPMGPLDPSV